MSKTQPERQVELDVRGMTCDSCAIHVTKALQGVEGVMQARVPSWSGGQAILSAREGVTDEQLLAAVKKAGYKARV